MNHYPDFALFERKIKEQFPEILDLQVKMAFVEYSEGDLPVNNFLDRVGEVYHDADDFLHEMAASRYDLPREECYELYKPEWLKKVNLL